MSKDTFWEVFPNVLIWLSLSLALLMVSFAGYIHINGPYYRCYYFDKDTSKGIGSFRLEPTGTNRFTAVYEAGCEYRDSEYHCGDKTFEVCREIPWKEYRKEVRHARSKRGF